MPWGMDENIIGIGNLPASLRSRIRNGIMVQRDGDGWTRFRPRLVVAAADGEACITDTDCVDHWIGDGSTFLDPDTPLPEATDRAPRPGDLIRLHKTLDPILVDIARYEGAADGDDSLGPGDGWRTGSGPYYACDWTLDGVIEE